MNNRSHETLDIDLVVSSTFVRTVVCLESTPSTNDYAKHLQPDSLQPLPALIFAAEQTAGRGQQRNRWWSGPGSLTFSLVLEDRQIDDPRSLPIVNAVAVTRALSLECPSLNPLTKWPNDVFVSSRKIAGVLIETLARGDRKLFVVGIGVNTNCDLDDADPEIQAAAISLFSILQRRIDQQRFLIRLLQAIDDCLQLSARRPEDLTSEYLAGSIFKANEELTLRSADGSEITGYFAGFGRSGELRLKIGSEIRETSTGHVVSPAFGVDNSASTGN